MSGSNNAREHHPHPNKVSLNRHQLAALPARIRSEGYSVIGPTVRSGAIDYAVIDLSTICRPAGRRSKARAFPVMVHPHSELLAILPTCTPVSAHVSVDLELCGCPISKDQLLELLEVSGSKNPIPLAPAARQAGEEAGLRGPCRNPYRSIVARCVEIRPYLRSHPGDRSIV